MNRDEKVLGPLRRHYGQGRLLESEADPDPLKQFGRWFREAGDCGILEPNAMVLATVDADGLPSARVVLMKGFGPEGFVFYTNYLSRKGLALEHNPNAALVFYWDRLERQVRVEGGVVRLPAEQSDAYFAARPVESRLGASVSRQSRVVAGRDVLETRMRAMRERWPEGDLPRPSFWGGYRLQPRQMEFWQGRVGRLHDRLRYRAAEQNWVMERLEP